MKSLRLPSVPAVFLMLVALVPLSQAQNPPNRIEKKQDQSGLNASTSNWLEDRRDVDRLSDLVMKWDQVRFSGDKIQLESIENRIAAELRNDLRETEAQVREADREVKQSGNEVKSSRREHRRERRDGDQDRRGRRDDRRDLKDDKRDLKDDQKDAAQAEALLKKKQETVHRLIALQKEIDSPGKAGDAALKARWRSLLEDYLKLSQEEIKLGVREVQEDKSEIREDRRERREDRRD
jgi:hypothetical protein